MSDTIFLLPRGEDVLLFEGLKVGLGQHLDAIITDVNVVVGVFVVVVVDRFSVLVVVVVFSVLEVLEDPRECHRRRPLLLRPLNLVKDAGEVLGEAGHGARPPGVELGVTVGLVGLGAAPRGQTLAGAPLGVEVEVPGGVVRGPEDVVGGVHALLLEHAQTTLPLHAPGVHSSDVASLVEADVLVALLVLVADEMTTPRALSTARPGTTHTSLLNHHG